MRINEAKNITPILLKELGKFIKKGTKQAKYYGLYKCPYCNSDFISEINNIKSGNTKSCGCINKQLSKDRHKTHGLSKHILYHIWNAMKQRCFNKKSKAYPRYGGRGIKVCDRWLDINNFIEDMYPSYQEGLTLDRIDVNGDYEPDNCRWVTQRVQMCNTRDIMSTNTSGYRGVNYRKDRNIWRATIWVNNTQVYIGQYVTAIEAAKAYETYVRLNNLEHNFTPVLTEEELKIIIKEEN